MALLRALAAALNAFAVVYPALLYRSISRDVEKYEDEIRDLARIGDASSKLHIEVIAKRRDRALEQLRSLRSANNYPD